MKYILILLIVLIASSQSMAQSDTLSLEGAISTALEKNYGIMVGEKNSEIAAINNNWGNAGALPTLNFGATAGETWNFTSDDYRNEMLSASVSANWVLFRGFSIRINKQMLEDLQFITDGNTVVIVENTIVSVILEYYNVLLTKEQIGITEKLEKVSADRYEQEEMRKTMGSSVTYDLLQAKNAWLEDKANVLRAKTAFANAEKQLNYLMSIPLDTRFMYSSEFKAPEESYDFSDLSARLLENNNTLRTQYLSLEFNTKQIELAKSNYYPTLSMGASGGYLNSGNYFSDNSQLNSHSTGFDAGGTLNLSYSIYQGGTRRQAVEISKINQEIAEIQTEDMQQSLLNQLSQEYQDFELLRELLILAKENLSVAQLNMELSEQKYKNGTINSFNFRDVQNTYLNANVGYLSATFNLIRSHQNLMRLTGGVIDTYVK